MTNRRISLLMPLVAALALGAHLQPAHAQPSHHAGPPQYYGAATAVAPTVDGQVQRLLINPFGEVDGLLLADGRVVKMPPHLGEAVAAVVAPGQTVRVGGYAHGYSPNTIEALTVTNLQTGQTVVDQGPPWPRVPKMPPHLRMATLSQLQVSGVVQTLLHGRHGEVNGVILDNGAIVRFPPHAMMVPPQPGQTLSAVGLGTRNQYGLALEATALGPQAGAFVPFTGHGQPPRPR